jgi:hypothetical protein
MRPSAMVFMTNAVENAILRTVSALPTGEIESSAGTMRRS